jgi:cell division protein ZapA (FtsZ GTPase activity inhibitor)
MPELKLEIGGNSFEVTCSPGEEKSLQRAAKLLGAEAERVVEAGGRSTERQMLLLSGLMLADTMMPVEAQLAETEERLRAADERTRIAEAKAAMLAANALKLETAATHKIPHAEIERIAQENDAAEAALSKILAEVKSIAKDVAAGPA